MWWRKLGEVENEYTSHNFSLFAISVPKISKMVEISQSSEKNKFAQFFETRYNITEKVLGFVPNADVVADFQSNASDTNMTLIPSRALLPVTLYPEVPTDVARLYL